MWPGINICLFQDGMYTLELFGDGKSIVSCPISEVQPEWTDETWDPSKGVTVSLHFIGK